MKTALLLSGGMDSTCIAYWKRPDIGITVDYGQLPAEAEVAAGASICAALGIQHEVITVNCAKLGSGQMAGAPAAAVAPVPEWWPFRNQLLVTLAAMRAVNLGVQEIMIGALITDGVHADGRVEFVEVMCKLLQIQEGRIHLVAPAHHLTAPELVTESKIPMEVLAWAHSCHVANFACGQCRGCIKHYQTMEALNLPPY